MSVYDVEIATLEGDAGQLMGSLAGKAALVVNVASKCGFTYQYEGLQRLHDKYADRGFTVVGVPCNQFLEQEPGGADEIREFCTLNYGVAFPITEKIEVNGDGRHPLFETLTPAADTVDGHTGDVRWNFEKWLVNGDGSVVARFGTGVEPEDPQILEQIEATLSE
ncbi:MAG: glutathione peroxidase [Actinobacteria bacterium]|nr:glutathione peroxidase [Actinomycetota bacterium]